MINRLLLVLILGLNTFLINAQEKEVLSGKIRPQVVKEALDFSISKPLRELPPSVGPRNAEERKAFKKLKRRKENRLNVDLHQRNYPFADRAFPKGEDAVWQKKAGYRPSKGDRAVELNFQGQTSPYSPSDCVGAAGPNHFMQGINTSFAIWDKAGNQVVEPTDFNTLFTGVTGATRNDGDPIVIYDEQADRWLVAEFSLGGSHSDPILTTDYMLIAVSQTNDPTGAWYRWSFDVSDMPDYEKFGVWRDGYYMGTNTASGNDVYVFERDSMLAGASNPRMIGFDNPNRPNSGFHCIEPLDNDGDFAPAGTPGQFITINDDAWGGGTDQIWIYELTANWTNPASSTFERVQQIDLSAFDSNFGSGWNNIEQKGTSRKLDAIPQILMYRAQYRNFSDRQTIVCAHTVDVDDSDHAGIRWYELQNTGSGWSIRQQGTYAPDAHSRWLPSISMNKDRAIAVGYSISSSDLFPGIRYCGQSSSENAFATGLFDYEEEVVLEGAYSQSSNNRWGDYAGMSIDPSDDKTFWFTTQFVNSSGKKATQIVHFGLDTVIITDKDIRPVALLAPLNSQTLGASEHLKVKISNAGLQTVNQFDISYKINGAAVVTETVNTNLEHGESVEYTFAGTVDLSEVQVYNVQIITQLTGDLNANNDTLNTAIEHLEPTYCEASSGSKTYEHIKKVEIGTIQKSSFASLYSDHTMFSTNINKGDSLELKITAGDGYYSDKCKAWVDWNQDKDFEDEGEAFRLNKLSNASYKVYIKAPESALLGKTRLRIRLYDSSGSSNPNSEPCGLSGYGEVEDFSLKIETGTGIDELLKKEKAYFNNPADKQVDIHLDTDKKIKSIELIDMKGQLLLTRQVNNKKHLSLNTQDYVSGVYLIRFILKDGTNFSKKLIIKH